MTPQTDTLDHGTLKKLVKSGAISDAALVAEPAGWAVVLQVNRSQFPLAVKTGQIRRWSKADSAVKYLSQVGIHQFHCDARQFEAASQSHTRRPDASKKLQEAHQALEYDRWFREKVAEGQADVEAGRVKDHAEVMAAARDRLESRIAAARSSEA